MEKPPGYVAQGESSKVCLLKKAIYVMRKCTPLGCAVLAVYVDNILLTVNDEAAHAATKAYLCQHFVTHNLSPPRYLLGIEIAHRRDQMVLCQRKYALDLLEEMGMLGCKPTISPMEANIDWWTGSISLLEDAGMYHRLVGKLIYLTVTRPDIAYAVSILSHFMHAPRLVHLDGVYRVLAYIKHALGKGLLYWRLGHLHVEAYSDAGNAGDKADRKLHGGYATYVGGNLVTWRPQKQSVVSRSNAEPEYQAMSNTAAEMRWLRSLLIELGFPPPSPMRMYCDNETASFIARNDTFHTRTKHIEIDCHFIWRRPVRSLVLPPHNLKKKRDNTASFHYLGELSSSADMNAAFSHLPATAGGSGDLLRDACRALGCVYISLWSYLPHPANCLVSTDGWFCKDNQAQGQRLFDLYRRSFCLLGTGNLPGRAFTESCHYLEANEHELMSAARIPSQREFYQEAGIKTAVFMGQSDGEIELGMSTTSIEGTRERILSFFSEIFPPNLRSTSRLVEDAALIIAMADVLSSSSSSSSSSASSRTAFRRYNSSPSPLLRRSGKFPGQRAMKRAFTMMRQISDYSKAQDTSPGSHLHHAISERKRREKNRESFAALRQLLPPDTKVKDRVSVLGRARDCIDAMKGEISSLEEKNRALERHLKPVEEIATETRIIEETVEVRTSVLSSFSATIMRVFSVRDRRDAASVLVRVLESLKNTTGVRLLSVEARESSKLIKLIIQGGELDDVALVETVKNAVDQ
ncbi:uncharacterized protein LOC144703426 [Wolffia australiana]